MRPSISELGEPFQRQVWRVAQLALTKVPKSIKEHGADASPPPVTVLQARPCCAINNAHDSHLSRSLRLVQFSSHPLTLVHTAVCSYTK